MSIIPDIIYPLTNYEKISSYVASKLDTELINNTYDVPKHIGKGTVEAYNYEHLSAMLCCFEMNEDATIGRSYSDLEDYIDFGYILNGIADFLVKESTHDISNMMYGVYISTPSTVSHGIFKGNIRHDQFFILVKKSWLENYIGCKLPAILQNPDKPLMIYNSVSKQLIPILSLFVNSPKKTPFRKQQFYAKCLEILSLTVEDLLNNERLQSKQNFHPDDIGKILNIADYISQNIEKQLTIEVITKNFHINRDKLQIMFKSIYGKTVTDYAKQIRMNLAFKLLLQGRTVSEVGYQLGYSNLSHFSKAFKKVHGLNPSKILRNS